jgi:prepilin-type N-terminal cleavage/methylation domain-containing protein
MARHDVIRRGFTLVELLVVISIIGILIAMLLPAVQSVREAGRRAHCNNNVKQISTAMQTYHATHRRFPTNWGSSTNPDAADVTSKGHSWLSMLLPYVEMDPLWKTIKFGEAPSFANTATNQNNAKAAQARVQLYICPSDGGDGTSPTGMMGTSTSSANYATTNYKACSGSNWPGTSGGGVKANCKKTPFPNAQAPAAGYGGRNATENTIARVRDFCDGIICRNNLGTSGIVYFPLSIDDIKDGTSNTFAVGETIPEFCTFSSWYWWNGTLGTCGIPLNWDEPGSSRKDAPHILQNTSGFMSRHPGGGNFGRCDGSAGFISDSIDLEAYHAMATIDGSETIMGDY